MVTLHPEVRWVVVGRLIPAGQLAWRLHYLLIELNWLVGVFGLHGDKLALGQGVLVEKVGSLALTAYHQWAFLVVPITHISSHFSGWGTCHHLVLCLLVVLVLVHGIFLS
jgi:hypothetical protein